MKILMNFFASAAYTFLLAAFLFSCQKEKSDATSQEITEEEASTYSEESSEAEASFDDVADISLVAADEEDAASVNAGRLFLPVWAELRLLIGNCAEVSIIPNDNTYPKTITIDFGNGCFGPDGKYRKGKIVLHLTGRIRRPGSVLTISFVDFYLNRAHLEGTKIVSNLSEDHTIKFSVQVAGGKVSYPNGRGYKYQSIKYRNQIEGMDTRIVRDNVFQIEGRSHTEFSNGVTINLNTETPLIKKVACPWISNGTLKIKINSRVLMLDYGFPNNGNCDNKALLTWKDGTKQRVILVP